jgi:hypothetical protein
VSGFRKAALDSTRIGLKPGIIYAVLVATLVLVGIFMQERARAFQKNTMAGWLQNHPQGREVLDDFAM